MREVQSICLGEMTLEFTRLLTRLYDARIAKAGLKFTQYTLLSRIAAQEPILPSVLADQIGATASTMTRNIEVMTRCGWIEEALERSGRRRPLRLTEAGRQQLGAAYAQWEIARQTAGDALGPAHMDELERALAAAIAKLRQT